jgi:hypothetical protein
LREGLRLRVFENMVLRRTFWCKREEVKWEWRKLHNEELNDLYSSPNMVWVIKWRGMTETGKVSHMEERSCAYSVLVGKPEGKRALGRPRHRWEDNIKTYLWEEV